MQIHLCSCSPNCKSRGGSGAVCPMRDALLAMYATYFLYSTCVRLCLDSSVQSRFDWPRKQCCAIRCIRFAQWIDSITYCSTLASIQQSLTNANVGYMWCYLFAVVVEHLVTQHMYVVQTQKEMTYEDLLPLSYRIYCVYVYLQHIQMAYLCWCPTTIACHMTRCSSLTGHETASHDQWSWQLWDPCTKQLVVT